MYADVLYALPLALSLLAMYSGLQALRWGSDFSGEYFFKPRRCLFAAVALTTTSCGIFLLLIIDWLLTQQSSLQSDTFNFMWWGYHTFEKIAVLAFHNSVKIRVQDWQGAVLRHGMDLRKN